MGRCCVRACPHLKNRPGVDDTGMKCHTLPKDTERRQKWIDWVNRANIIGPMKDSKTKGICSAHFTHDSFHPGRQKLKDDAMPSIAPEITPEMAFKLGIARSAEDFIRSRELAEGRVIKDELLADSGDEQAEQSNTNSNYMVQADVEPSTANTSTPDNYVQAYSPCAEIQSAVHGASTSEIPVQRIFVVPIVKLKEHKEKIEDDDSPEDSCYSDPGESNPEKSTQLPPLVRCINAFGASSGPGIHTVTSVGTDSTQLHNGQIIINRATAFINVDNSFVNASTATPANITPENILITSNINAPSVKTRIIEGQSIYSTNAAITSAFTENTPGSALEQQEQTPPMLFKRKCYVRDLSPSDFNTPEKAKRSLGIVHKRMKGYQDRIKMMSQTLRRARKKIEDLESLLEDKKHKRTSKKT